MDADDIRWMRDALALARRGEGRTRPNPPVGAVVVSGGRVVGRGFHRRAGTAHAEIVALREAGAAAAGATLYVTLEPCSTWGRTGPCTEAILAAGIRRVVAAVRDPNPKHAGRGFRILRRAGLTVRTGVLEAEGQALLAPFCRWIQTGLPLVTLKLGMSADGRLADRAGRSQWITSPAARARVQELRRTADAIIVGGGTARADDPSLTCRRYPASKPWRVIVDSAGRLPVKARVLTDGEAGRTIVATTGRCAAARRRAYARAGATVWVLAGTRDGRVSLAALMRKLGRLGVLHALCEGGGTLAHALMRARLVDRLMLFVAPMALGRGTAAFDGQGWPLATAPRWRFAVPEVVGADVLLTGIVVPPGVPASRPRAERTGHRDAQGRGK